MLELKFATYRRAASLSLQASSAVLAEESLTRLSLSTESAMNAKDSPCLHEHNPYISNSTILNNNCFVPKWFVCMCTTFENGIANEAIVLPPRETSKL